MHSSKRSPAKGAELAAGEPEANPVFRAIRLQINAFDALFLVVLFAAVFFYHHDLRYWASQATVGNWQYGDAEFWWNGAIQFAEGIVRDNPNLTYRMGFAVVGGLWVALFGTNFSWFHTFLLVQFIFAWYALYLILQAALSRAVAAGAILLVALNPFTVEWISISTSDSLGLLLNTWALIFLMVGFSRNLEMRWLALCGLFVALGSLTRPLMTPFLAPAILLPLLAMHLPWQRRAKSVAALFIGFVIPTAAWIGVLRSVTGETKLAGSDAATFYAGSDPKVQLWRPDMFPAVEASAKQRFGVANVSAAQLDQELWHLTRLNYVTFWRYHLKRAIPHVRRIAAVSIESATHVDSESRWLRRLVIALLGASLIVRLVRRRVFLRAAAMLVILAAWLIPPWSTAVVLIALIAAIPLAFRNKSASSAAVLVSYWCVGVAALYFVGGTWGDPSRVVDLTALGYRLGAQFFFVADLVVLFFVSNLCRLGSQEAPEAATARSRRWFSAFVSIAMLVWAGLTLCTVAAGAGTVAYHVVERSRAVPRPFPDLSTAATFCATQLRIPLQADRIHASSGRDALAALAPNEDSPYILTSASSTDFIWNLEGQQRSKVDVALQTVVSPFDFSPRIFVDFPVPLRESEWTRRQGAWLLRRIADEPLISNLPWYISDIAIRAFIPLNAAQTAYDTEKAVWFRLPKYASELRHARQLDVEGGALKFSPTSGTRHYPRRFAVQASSTDAPATLVIDAAKAVGNRNLTFAVQLEPSSPVSGRRVTARVLRFDAAGRELSSESVSIPPPVWQQNFDLNQPRTEKLRIEFSGLKPGDTVWIYELNLIADDWEF